jgi:N6-L-threonylcarbamoyladenine synthase
VSFPPSQIKHPDRKEREKNRRSELIRFDFSYSGIKTAVLRYAETHHLSDSIEKRRRNLSTIPQPKLQDYIANCDQQTLDLVASFQRAMVEDLIGKTLAAAQFYDVATIFVTGGVAANNELRQRFERDAAMEGIPVYFPSRPLSTDNAAMIAAAAYPKFLAADFAPLEFSAEAGMSLK